MLAFHGSDIEKIASTYQVLPKNLINYGVNANPLGLSPLAKAALEYNIHLITSYPDPSYHSLKQAIHSYLNVDAGRVLLSNGTSELIHQIIRYYSPKRALLYTPTYSEYAKEVKKQGGEVVELPLRKENQFRFPTELFYQALADCNFVLLCNPNNPTATTLNISELLPLLEASRQRNIPFLIDETYIEFTENPEHYSATTFLHDFNNLIILRGFSKFFAAPGLRLGYGLFGNQDLIDELQASYPWGIHSLAAFAGEIFLSDIAYIQQSRKYIYSERKRILSILQTLPKLTVYPTGVNFFLLELQDKNATDLFLYLLNRGLLIRNFHDEIAPGFFRFCILESDKNDLLLQAIQDFLAE